MAGRVLAARRADVFGARELQIREFVFYLSRLDSDGRMRGEAGSLVGRRTSLLRAVAGGHRRGGFPDFMGVDLRLAEAGEIVGDGFFIVEAEMLGVGANESLVEDAAWELVKVLLLDGLQHAGTDFGDVGNVLQRDVFFLACGAKFVSECAHFILPVAMRSRGITKS